MVLRGLSVKSALLLRRAPHAQISSRFSRMFTAHREAFDGRDHPLPRRAHALGQGPAVLRQAWLLAAIVLLLVASGPGDVRACVGDCDGNGSVTVDEVVTGVSIALGARPLAECESLDGNSDQLVTVDEIILALSHALSGCPANPSATATPVGAATETMVATATSTPEPSPTPIPAATSTATASPTVALGPVITFFGLTRPDGETLTPTATTSTGVPIFQRPAGFGFQIVIEGRPGPSGSSVGQCNTSYDEFSPDSRPDVQILSSRDIGPGNPAVCDGPQPAPETGGGCGGRPEPVVPIGGIPAVEPPDFTTISRRISDAMNDFGCRLAYKPQGEACTVVNGNWRYVSNQSVVQFCTERVWASPESFPSGDTTLTVRLRDFSGRLGAPAQIVIRVP